MADSLPPCNTVCVYMCMLVSAAYTQHRVTMGAGNLITKTATNPPLMNNGKGCHSIALAILRVYTYAGSVASLKPDTTWTIARLLNWNMCTRACVI
jgi:hypothetical protein